ncbi:uncharacterized protein RSE6_12575 [Rhynchosporium secalis]|uniref:Uncharacterized protein n=1 Tax=Rhynchosporium secalis TaxID=38038 RepID=A0A1E1MQR2_RHYSE|nr:uncharacterized protein RSE6_12575 [Rhynchosporium secalis]
MVPMGKGTNRTVRRLGYLGMRGRRRRRPWCMSDGLGAASRVWYFGRLLLKCGSALSPTEDRNGIPGAARIHSGVFSWDLMKRKTKEEIRNRVKLWASTDCSRRRIDVIADVVVGVGVGVAAIQPLSVPAWVPTLLCLVPH